MKNDDSLTTIVKCAKTENTSVPPENTKLGAWVKHTKNFVAVTTQGDDKVLNMNMSKCRRCKQPKSLTNYTPGHKLRIALGKKVTCNDCRSTKKSFVTDLRKRKSAAIDSMNFLPSSKSAKQGIDDISLKKTYMFDEFNDM